MADVEEKPAKEVANAKQEEDDEESSEEELGNIVCRQAFDNNRSMFDI